MTRDERARFARPGPRPLGSLLAAMALTAGLAACADDAGDDGGGAADAGPESSSTVASPTPSSSTPVAADSPLFGTPILIETRILDAVEHRGRVAATSVLGEAAFCPGGRAGGGSEGAAITTTFHCRGGTLQVRYSPIQRSLVQGATWEVVGGTGDFAALRGGGSMVAVFDEDDPDRGREVFTGAVGE